MEISIKLHKRLSDDADFAYTKQSTDGAIINDFGVFFFFRQLTSLIKLPVFFIYFCFCAHFCDLACEIADIGWISNKSCVGNGGGT